MKAGKSFAAISRELGLHVQTVSKWAKEAGIERVRRPGRQPKLRTRLLAKDIAGEAERLYETGLPLTEVSQYVGIQPEALSRALRQRGVVIRPAQHSRSAERVAEIAQKISESKRTAESRAKSRATNLRRFGREHHLQSGIPAESVRILADREAFRVYIERSRTKTVSHLAMKLGCSYSTVERHVKDHQFHDMIDWRISTPEQDLRGELESWGLDPTKDRSVLDGKEIDLFLPTMGIGIEFNGDYYHSPTKFPHRYPGYHKDKSDLAKSKGIFLYHVFEWEWGARRRQILGQIRSILGMNSRRISARECSIRRLGAAEMRDFTNANHRQGACPMTLAYGLIHDGEIVSAMSFGPPRFTRGVEWELLRFCSLDDTTVIGGASRLFQQFLRTHHPQSIVSFSDIARARGGLYARLGFRLDGETVPNYRWCRNGETISRYQAQMPDERRIMESRGFVQVFDCGSQRWLHSAL